MTSQATKARYRASETRIADLLYAAATFAAAFWPTRCPSRTGCPTFGILSFRASAALPRSFRALPHEHSVQNLKVSRAFVTLGCRE